MVVHMLTLLFFWLATFNETLCTKNCEEDQIFSFNTSDTIIVNGKNNSNIITLSRNGSYSIHSSSPIHVSFEKLANDSYKINFSPTNLTQENEELLTGRRIGINIEDELFAFQCTLEAKGTTKGAESKSKQDGHKPYNNTNKLSIDMMFFIALLIISLVLTAILKNNPAMFTIIKKAQDQSTEFIL